MHHKLKTSVPLFAAIKSGAKSCKVVRAQIGVLYAVGDQITLTELIHDSERDAKYVSGVITFVEPLAPVDCPETYFVLSFKLT